MTSALLGRLGLAVATGMVAAASLTAPAAAASTGILNGMYTTAGGTPLGGAIISVWTGDGADVWTHEWTDANGHYEVTLPTGDYLLGFQSEYGASQWSPGQLNKADAKAYTIADGAILTVDEQEL